MSKLAMASPGSGWPYAVAALLLLPALCLANDVQVVAVTPGRSADVVIAGGPPLTIEIGETVSGIMVLRADRDGAVLRINGVTKTLPLVAYRGPVGDGSGGGSVTLSADERGHFFTRGTVNGKPVRFIVDTGATLTTLSRAHAERIGIDYGEGTPILGRTPNGIMKGWRVSLDSVRIGGVTVRNVDAMVVDSTMPVGLLGMSFLRRFDMHRQGSTLVLLRRRR